MLSYFDCFSGAGGDMIVGALLDAGCDIELLRSGLAGLKLPGFEIDAEKVQRGGLAGMQFRVNVSTGRQPRRNLDDILSLIAAADLPPRAADRAGRIFTRLAEAEAKVHNIAVNEVHFHEVGAVDSIVDIVAACLSLEILAVDRVVCSPIPIGSGTVPSGHGTLPLPSPATAELLIGARTACSDLAGERTTPTAAAVLTVLSESYGPPPAMDLAAVGYGAGTRDEPDVPNLLRVLIGSQTADGTADNLVELSANVDDCTGEVIGAALEKLLSAGCADAWATPIFMKKSRPAWTVSVLCAECDVPAAERILYAETTTFGIRRRPCARSKLTRRHETVETAYGPIRIKTGLRGEEIMTASPEFSDCLRAAEAHHAAVKEVIAAARAVYLQGTKT
ncbi:MAG: nickel pincer cofactor biosynthesis protein LarC [Planctomycetota bacterium]|nr:nickel pincer cofactor biosynthesis protein LarC [Planctomycetota bacterium]